MAVGGQGLFQAAESGFLVVGQPFQRGPGQPTGQLLVRLDLAPEEVADGEHQQKREMAREQLPAGIDLRADRL